MHKLSAYKELTGKTQEQLASEFGISRAHLSKLLRGKAFPSRKQMLRIEEVTRGLVPVTAWFEAEAQRGAA